jgi:hypothetical protein
MCGAAILGGAASFQPPPTDTSTHTVTACPIRHRRGRADKAVQRHFADHDYAKDAKVIVFCMAECRNNIGAWPTRHIEPPSERKDFRYYAAKDLAMAQCGVMLWDAKSQDTLQNMLNLVGAGKRTLVYFSPSSSP